MALVLGAVLIVSLMVLAKHQLSKPAVPAEIHADSASPVAGAETKVPMETPLPPLAAPVDPPPAPAARPGPVLVAELSDEERQAKIAGAIMQLNAALMQNDSNSTALIMASLTNAEKEVREQAVSAVKQLGDRDLIPALTNLAAQTENYEDRHALQEAADFIALPTLTELERDLKPNTTPGPLPPDRPRSTGARQGHGTRGRPQPVPVDGSAAPNPGAVPNQ